MRELRTEIIRNGGGGGGGAKGDVTRVKIKFVDVWASVKYCEGSFFITLFRRRKVGTNVRAELVLAAPHARCAPPN